MTGTKAKLCDYLSTARETVIFKSEGLSERLARTPRTPTGTHILGIVHHLAITEYEYFGTCLNRTADDPYIRQLLAPHDPDTDFLPPTHFNAEQIIALYKKAIAFADEAIADLSLASAVTVPWWGPNGATTLEHLLIHVLSETARHAGHLDIVREQLDARTGWTAELSLLPDYTADQWASHRAQLQQIADKAPPQT